MATPRCGKCDSTRFEADYQYFAGKQVLMIHCVSCGTVAGAVTGPKDKTLTDLETRLERIERKLR